MECLSLGLGSGGNCVDQSCIRETVRQDHHDIDSSRDYLVDEANISIACRGSSADGMSESDCGEHLYAVIRVLAGRAHVCRGEHPYAASWKSKRDAEFSQMVVGVASPVVGGNLRVQYPAPNPQPTTMGSGRDHAHGRGEPHNHHR